MTGWELDASGFEPPPSGLEILRSKPTELRVYKIKSETEGLEPPKCMSQDHVLYQLSYVSKFLKAGRRIRTSDTRKKLPTLPLSYSRN